MAKKQEHAHKLKRLRYKSGNTIYFCILPDCKYKSAAALVFGKRAVCWRCGNEFLMNEYSIRLAKPHCEACHLSKSSKVEGHLSIPEMEYQTSESLMDRLQREIKEREQSSEEDI